MRDELPALRDVVAQHGLWAKRSLGQNFLFDLNLTNRIASFAAPLQDQHVLEIGPGPGGLTRALLSQGAYVTAIEQDARCIPILEEIARVYPGKLHIVQGDALQQDYLSLFRGCVPKPKIVANLPYNIGTALLLHWLLQENWPPFYHSLTLMFQREVAERIIAQPGDPQYGRLSVLCNWRTSSQILLNIPPQAFIPAPKIMSSVVRLVPKEMPLQCDCSYLQRVTKAAFGQRRKMLRQSLKSLADGQLLEKAGIDGQRRAETLSTEEFVALANALAH